MFITTELLHKHQACEQGIRYFERFYPNGAEMLEIIQDRHIDKEFLHWGRENLTHTSEELAAYCEACDIVDSDGFWYSQKIHNSRNVIKSKKVDGSERIFHSKEISNSSDIAHGEDVSDSTQIFSSSMIAFSTLIAHCANVTQSKNVCFSTAVINSVSIFNSENVYESSEIIRSENVTNSYFCNDCKNIENCMFCDGIENAKYHIFNQPVTKERFEIFVQQYKKFMQGLLNFTQCWPENLVRSYTPEITQKFDEWYKSVPEKFWKWASTLPGFDSMLMYNMTMLPKFLVD